MMTESDSRSSQIQKLIDYGRKLRESTTDPRKNIDSWLPSVKSILPRNYLGRITRLQLYSYVKTLYGQGFYKIVSSDVDAILVLLKDELLKLNYDSSDEREWFALRILHARENSDELEKLIAERMCGENPDYPQEISLDLENLFISLGHKFYANRNNPIPDVTEFLMRLDSIQLLDVIQNGLFNKRYYLSLYDIYGKQLFDAEAFRRATEDFNALLDELSIPSEPISLSHIFNVNQTYDLIFSADYDTPDNELNSLLEEARKFYLASEYQIAIEKLWDGFERLKTVLDTDKCNGANKLIEKMAVHINKSLLEDEFKILKSVGNDYRIRHHETGKITLSSDVEKRYLYFRMLALIEYALHSLKK